MRSFPIKYTHFVTSRYKSTIPGIALKFNAKLNFDISSFDGLLNKEEKNPIAYL